MAEIGIIASIIGVAGAGFRLSLILNAVGCEVASAGMEIHSIAKSVSLFALMLKQVGATLKESDSIHSAEAVATAEEIKEQCQVVFDEITDMLDKVQKKDEYGNSRGPSLQQKFKWCFKKQRVQYLLAQLESLKLSLIVMMQILHLGKLMAPTRDPVDPVVQTDLISQEKAEVQNMVIIRYWSINRLDRLYEMAADEDERDEKRIEDSPVESRPLALEAPPAYTSSSKALIKMPVVSLGELDASMNAIRESPREMLRVSGEVINPLLSRWTRLDELREQAKRGYYPYNSCQANGSFTGSSNARYEYYETDEEDSPSSPIDTRQGGYYLEGTTTDWRKPHSIEAKRERSRLRRQYESFQPKVDSDASDHDELGPLKTKRAPTRHVIDSDEESEPDEYGTERPRRKSDGSRLDKVRNKETRDPSRPRSYHPDARTYASDKYPASPRPSISSQGHFSAHQPAQNQGRPMVTPFQNPNLLHSVSSPLPPQHGQPVSPNRSPYGSPYTTYNNTNPVAPPPYPANFRGSYGPGFLQPQQTPHSFQGQQIQQQRGFPPLTMPRASEIPQVRPGSRHSTSSKSGRSPRDSSEIQEAKEMKRRKEEFKKGATRGILGGVGIASFLEILEGLSI